MSAYISKDHAQEFTNSLIEIIESGKPLPWSKPWASDTNGAFLNLKNKTPYSGVNIIMLLISCYKNSFSSSYWATFQQITEMGGKVKKGSKGTVVSFYKEAEIDDKDTGEKKKIHVRKFFTVFNFDQIEGIALPEVKNAPYAELTADARKENLLNYLMAYSERENIKYRDDAESAYYSVVGDSVNMPKQFKTVAGYCGTLAHEFMHSTGHWKRLARFKSEDSSTQAQEPIEDYAKEELVAEIGAGMICNLFGIDSELENHASYLKSWLKALKNDREFIFKAAGAAQKAVNFIADVVSEESEAA